MGYMNLMGIAYEGLNRMDSALYYRHLAYQTALDLDDSQLLALNTANLADFYLGAGKYNDALYYYKLAYPSRGKKFSL